jgi:2-C-methyl-D-erythritol 4-phosphate cytidylyltransferase
MMEEEKIVCIVAAAGRGMRFGRDIPKSFYPVEGSTLLARSIQSLSAWKGLSDFIVMIPSGWEVKARDELERNAPGRRYEILAGGENRQESVAIGLKAIDRADMVLVHDACRPIVSCQLIDRVVSAARESGAAVPALGVTETLGRLRNDALEGIVPRDRVICVQTPQVFGYGILKKSFEAARETIGTATDESSIVLAAGYPVKVVEGERWNVKVTVKEDLEIIKSFIAGKKLDFAGSGTNVGA